MAVDLTLSIRALIAESSALDNGTAVMTHLLEFPGTLGSGNYLTGTTDNKQNRVWTDTRTLVATSETLDLYGSLPEAIGGAVINFVEVRGILIKNRATNPGFLLTVGNGAAAAYQGLFNGAAERIKVPASGCFLWFAPLDGGGLVVTNTTAQDFKLDSGAATITYDIAIWGVDS
ncbi:MAG: hypothetical protein Q8P18_18350 [Pseudomonadota bacterium]|nr:hypothetical protein [Pseudomonadota bacterium]